MGTQSSKKTDDVFHTLRTATFAIPHTKRIMNGRRVYMRCVTYILTLPSVLRLAEQTSITTEIFEARIVPGTAMY